MVSSATTGTADVKSIGDVAHILLYRGTTSELASIEYLAGSNSYQMWSTRPALSSVTLDSGVEIATIDVDSQGRMWLASDGASTILVRYSDAPYDTWSGPITLATGVSSDDISVVTALPNGSVGVLWSDQTTQRFGFRLHTDGADPATWAADEVPASQSALNVGLGMGDDHLNVAVASDATIYAAVKTSYDTGGYPKIALLVRRPAGTWDDLYEVDQSGTRGIALLDEGAGTISIIYTSTESSGDIVFKESPTSSIAFGSRSTLMPGAFNDVTSTKQNISGNVVLLARSTSSSNVNGVLRSTGGSSPVATLTAPNGGQTWVVGSSQNITWTASDDVGVTSVNLELSTNGGGTWGSIATGLSNTGTYAWTVPNAPTVTARVRVTAIDIDSNSGTDSGDANFEIASPASNDLVGHWPMEEGSGSSVLDASGEGNDGALTGSPTWVTGIQGSFALQLNGSQYAQVLDDPTLDITGAITLATWVRPQVQATQYLIKKAVNSATDGYELGLSAGTATPPGKPFIRFNQTTSGNTYRVNASSDYPINGTTWMHVAATYDGATIRLYINGVEESSLAAAITIATNNLALGLGSDSNGGSPFNGAMDDVRVYGRALSAAEILALTGGDVPTATVTSPNGGEVWTAGSSHDITWSATDDVGVTSVNLEFSSDGGGSWSPIATGLSNTGTYGWTVPNTPTTTARVRVTAFDIDSNSGSDVSNADFTIQTLLTAAALQFDGVNDYVTFGAATAALGASRFTLETWFKKTGAGVTVSTGASGLGTALPLVTKGRGEGDGSNVDMNYFLGLQDGKLAADFEDDDTGLNHPVIGATTLLDNTWYHGAATFDGTSLRVYVNGVLDGTTTVTAGQDPRFDSIQHAGLGTAMTSTGATAGFFAGILDEPRIWNYARNQCDIVATMNSEVTSGTGLLGRWGLNDGSGTVATNSVGGSPDGTLTPAGNPPLWVPGSPFDATPPVIPAPADPTGLAASAPDGMRIDLTWTDNATNEEGYQVERSTSGMGGPFSLLATLAANAASYTDVPLTASIEYCYRVRATKTCPGHSDYSGTACATPTELCNALDFTGSAGYVNLGTSATLQLTSLTIEMWMRRDGTGVGTNTGTGGIPDLIPLIAKGRADAEVAAQDINYIFGIRASDGVLAADFEEGPTGTSPSLNHPVAGTTVMTTGTWRHVAATYDGATWKLYVNGVENASLGVGQPLGSASTVAVAMASALTLGGTAAGFFDGAVDEVRIWNVARTQPQIAGTMNLAITTPQAGLVGRWGLNEGTGTIAYGTAGTSINGTIVGATPAAWSRTTGTSAGYAITASSGSGGSIVPSGSVTVACGGSQAFTIAPVDGCHAIADVLVDGVSVGPVAAYSFTDVLANHTIAASFVPFGPVLGETHVDASCGTPDGSIDLVVTSGTSPYGYAWSNSATTEDLAGLAAGTYSVTVTDFNGCTANLSVAIEVPDFTITASAGANGSIAPSGAVSVECGADAEFDITPDPGYVIDALVVDGNPVPATPSYTFTNVSASHTISVSFKSEVLAVETRPADFALGHVTPNPAPGAMRLEYGLPKETSIRLSVLDIQGREVAVLAHGLQPAGWHWAAWSGAAGRSQASAGLYFIRLQTAERTITRRFAFTR